jgi:hypothetical protein
VIDETVVQAAVDMEETVYPTLRQRCTCSTVEVRCRGKGSSTTMVETGDKTLI